MVLGGAKVSDKLAVIEALLPKVDRLLIGGGMCFTFLKAQGYEVGESLLEEEMVDTCRDLLARAGDRIVLPTDMVAATAFAADAEHDIVRGHRDPRRPAGPGHRPGSVAAFAEALDGRPDGVLERSDGRVRAGAVRRRHPRGGRGDHHGRTGSPWSAAATRPRRSATLGLDESAFGHISTGGGASLEYLEGKTLPGLAALEA